MQPKGIARASDQFVARGEQSAVENRGRGALSVQSLMLDLASAATIEGGSVGTGTGDESDF